MSKKTDKYLKRIRAITKTDSVDILSKFKSSFGHLSKKGLEIEGIVNLMDDFNVISISHPLIFDNRLIPETFMGLAIRGHIHSDSIPDYFSSDDIWFPDNFVRFVDENEALIRENLNLKDSDKNELLDAICFGDFKKHLDLYNKKK
jgi:hypothetical protein